MQKEFENALEGLLNFDHSEKNAEQKFNTLFKQMISASMKICAETDFAALIDRMARAAEQKYGVKMAPYEDENDLYRKLRDVVRFEMSREAVLANMDYEICCTEENYRNALGKFQADLEKIVPGNQPEVLASMSQALYSDFTNFFVSETLDMVADFKIYKMPEFRALQLNALGKEVRTCANIVKQQNAKPQKSETVTSWFRTMFVLPALQFKSLYGVDMIQAFDVAQKYVDDAAHMHNIFRRNIESFVPGDEYKILLHFLAEMGLSSCFTVRPKVAEQGRGVKPS